MKFANQTVEYAFGIQFDPDIYVHPFNLDEDAPENSLEFLLFTLTEVFNPDVMIDSIKKTNTTANSNSAMKIKQTSLIYMHSVSTTIFSDDSGNNQVKLK